MTMAPFSCAPSAAISSGALPATRTGVPTTSPLVERDQVRGSMVVDLVERLFAGDVTELVSHLLDECDVTPDELAKLKQLIRQRERKA